MLHQLFGILIDAASVGIPPARDLIQGVVDYTIRATLGTSHRDEGARLMALVESAWPQHPDYSIKVVPVGVGARVVFGDLVLAESEHALRLEEEMHVDRLYFPVSDVNWDLFAPSTASTTCPFKGRATYWSLIAVDPIETDVAWTYAEPFDEVAGIQNYVAFYQERVRIELVDRWDGDTRSPVMNEFPAWGDAADLLTLIDVRPEGDSGHFVGPAYRDTTRNVVEGGQMLAQGIVAASKRLPRQHVTSATMFFPKAAAFSAPLDVEMDVVREGRTFSTAEVRISQEGELRSIGLFFLDSGAPSVIDGQVDMPDVAGPYDAEPFDMRVTGRDLRIVNGDYRADPDYIGPPVIYAWIRFKEAPSTPCLHAALVAQPTTHWTIAAAMLPHPGYGEAMAHVTLSTGIMGVNIAFHDDVDVTQLPRRRARAHGRPYRDRRDRKALAPSRGRRKSPPASSHVERRGLLQRARRRVAIVVPRGDGSARHP